MTKPLTPLRTLPAGRAQRRAPAGRPTVAPLVGDLETRPRELKADLVALLRPDTTLVLDLRDATFLGPAAARLLLDLRGQAAAPAPGSSSGDPTTSPTARCGSPVFDRIVDLRPPSCRPEPGPRHGRGG